MVTGSGHSLKALCLFGRAQLQSSNFAILVHEKKTNNATKKNNNKNIGNGHSSTALFGKEQLQSSNNVQIHHSYRHLGGEEEEQKHNKELKTKMWRTTLQKKHRITQFDADEGLTCWYSVPSSRSLMINRHSSSLKNIDYTAFCNSKYRIYRIEVLTIQKSRFFLIWCAKLFIFGIFHNILLQNVFFFSVQQLFWAI